LLLSLAEFEQTMAAVWLEAHGKAILIKGDTMMIKDFLKSKGGKWSGPLKSWIFPGSKKAALVEDLQSSGKVKSVEDRTDGSAAPAAPAAAPPAKPAAKAREGPAKRAAASDGEKVFELGDEVRATITNFQNKQGVDLRKFYVDKGSGEVKPTPKGIRFSAEEWQAACSAAVDIDTALEKGKETSWSLIGDIMISITGGSLDFRRFYVDKTDGASKPGKKGIRLGSMQWSSLKAEMPQISQELGASAAGGGGPAAAKKPKTKAAVGVPDLPQEQTEIPGEPQGAAGKWKHELCKILKGRDLMTISLRKVRAELEEALSLPADGLLSHKEEVKTIVTGIIQSGEAA